jgi:hypothetical protein
VFIPSYQKISDDVDESNETDDLVSNLIDSGDFSDDELNELSNLSDEEIESLVNDSAGNENSETSESDEELGEPQAKETDDIDDLLSNRAQKRIDKLTAEKKAAAEEVESLKTKLNELEAKLNGEPKTEKKDDRLSDDQIAKAIQKGVDEGDMSVIVDAIKYIAEETKKGVLKEQEDLQKAQIETAQKKAMEWAEITNEYSPEAYQYESLKADPDFDITNNKSKLFRLASRLFVDKGYANENKGQTRAVREAYSILLERKLNDRPVQKANTSETEGLKARLAKEQRKKAFLSGGDTGGEQTRKEPITENNELDSYIANRAKSKEEKLGVFI